MNLERNLATQTTDGSPNICELPGLRDGSPSQWGAVCAKFSILSVLELRAAGTYRRFGLGRLGVRARRAAEFCSFTGKCVAVEEAVYDRFCELRNVLLRPGCHRHMHGGCWRANACLLFWHWFAGYVQAPLRDAEDQGCYGTCRKS